MKTAAARLPTDGDDETGLHAAVRRAAMQRKEPCILDLCVKNARDFEQGRPDLVARDLDESIVGDPAVWQRVDSLMHEHGVYDAFELRGELINYKKALYHLYQEAMALEKDLRQLSALLHCSLSAAPASVAPGQTGAAADQRDKYVKLSEALMACKGTVLALQDARSFTKAICSVPRHVDEPRFPQLAGLPASLHVSKRLRQSEKFLSALHDAREEDAGMAVAAATESGVPAGTNAAPGTQTGENEHVAGRGSGQNECLSALRLLRDVSALGDAHREKTEQEASGRETALPGGEIEPERRGLFPSPEAPHEHMYTYTRQRGEGSQEPERRGFDLEDREDEGGREVGEGERVASANHGTAGAAHTPVGPGQVPANKTDASSAESGSYGACLCNYIALSLVARGCTKALTIRDEALCYRAALASTLPRFHDVMDQLHTLAGGGEGGAPGGDGDGDSGTGEVAAGWREQVPPVLTRASVKAARQGRLLGACRTGVCDTIRWLTVLLARHSRGLNCQVVHAGGWGVGAEGQGVGGGPPLKGFRH